MEQEPLQKPAESAAAVKPKRANKKSYTGKKSAILTEKDVENFRDTADICEDEFLRDQPLEIICSNKRRKSFHLQISENDSDAKVDTKKLPSPKFSIDIGLFNTNLAEVEIIPAGKESVKGKSREEFLEKIGLNAKKARSSKISRESIGNCCCKESELPSGKWPKEKRKRKDLAHDDFTHELIHKKAPTLVDESDQSIITNSPEKLDEPDQDNPPSPSLALPQITQQSSTVSLSQAKISCDELEKEEERISVEMIERVHMRKKLSMLRTKASNNNGSGSSTAQGTEDAKLSIAKINETCSGDLSNKSLSQFEAQKILTKVSYSSTNPSSCSTIYSRIQY